MKEFFNTLLIFLIIFSFGFIVIDIIFGIPYLIWYLTNSEAYSLIGMVFSLPIGMAFAITILSKIFSEE